MDLIDIFRIFHPNAEYTFFSSAHGPFSRIDHILSHKSNLNKLKKSASILWCSNFFIVQLSHPYMTTGKTIAMTRNTFVEI